MPKMTSTKLTKRIVEGVPLGGFAWDVEVPGYGVRVTASGTRSFIFQFRTKTREAGRMSIGRFPAMTVEEARSAARTMRGVVESGGHPTRERRSVRDALTLGDLADRYCGEYARYRLKPATIKDARALIDRYVIPSLGRRKVGDLAPSDIRKVHNDARDGSGKYQANRLRAYLSKMFSLAMEDDQCARNPCKGVPRFQEDQRWTYMSEAQVMRLLQSCDRFPDQRATNAIRLLLFTGARLREVLNATWSQFDLEQGIWDKPSSHTKTQRRHTAPLAQSAIVLLRAMRSEDPTGTLLFPGRNGSKPRHDLKHPWKALLNAAGLPAFRIHDLRRTTATFMLSTGSDLATVGKALGHTQASTTARYAQLFQESQRRGIDRAVSMMGKVT